MLRFSNNSYEMKTLNDLFSRSNKKNKENSIKNVITNSAQYGLIRQSEYFGKSITNEENLTGYFIIEEGDFVYNPRKSSIAPFRPFKRYGLPEEGVVSSLYTCLKPKVSLNDNYMLYYFDSSAWHKYVYKNGDQGARHDRVNIKATTFMNLPIYYPTDEEQQKIAECLTAFDNAIEDLQKTVKHWKNIKKGLLQQLFDWEGVYDG